VKQTELSAHQETVKKAYRQKDLKSVGKNKPDKNPFNA
jgi:hypothetical protein